EDVLIENLLTDSRKLLFAESSLFFALNGLGRNGISFIKTLYEKGVKNFIVNENFTQQETIKYPDAFFLQVTDVLAALQKLVTFHRHTFQYPVIGITGSNGKTIVKEWLTQLLGDEYNIARNIKSYNSQIGVPLSVWRMNEGHTLGIFESGISQPNEMSLLQKIIDPPIGIVTFIGSAHAEGFNSLQHKIQEKLQLFTNSKMLIYGADDEMLSAEINNFRKNTNPLLHVFEWSKKKPATLFVKDIFKNENSTEITCEYDKKPFTFSIPFTDEASVNNAITCCCTMLYLKVGIENIIQKMNSIRTVAMRLELKQGINNCSIINDGYSADIQSLGIALDFLVQQNQHEKRTVILSDVLQTGEEATQLYSKISKLLSQKNIHRLIGIGTEISANSNLFSSIKATHFYESTEAFLTNLSNHHFHNEIILLKAARIFHFEKISNTLEQKFHETTMEVNLNALRHNLNVYRQMLQPAVKMMAMVKAFSYGSGSFEIANVLQHAGVDYLAVAYTDEGVDLRNAGITLPIMVMNCEPSGFENMVKHQLEPELYSFKILHAFISFLTEKNREHYPVHIKIDTGMHRLGFDENEIEILGNILKENNTLKVTAVFSHLAGSDAADHDHFTQQQTALFLKAANKIESIIGYNFIRHISNSSAIYRHPHLQMNMVRLGIGLYGIDATPEVQHRLQHVTTLKTTIAQIKNLKKGETIGYSRKGIALKDMRSATVRIGYADGYPRILSNGKGKMMINGNPAPVIGNICMDMTMLDITDIDANEGDEVIVFGEEPTVSNVAKWADTIPYEILTNISQRVKRVYFEE
ncbi:MAG: bifunctional UDP-N-acetylmuramoyl-tripeptide:D-alanyl-D-alanine ligase/alanine racemase, partial [Ferruginibacter sp.]|nr:bifunctional UDP-N-acetylmuramoyl-tripeptide:D-alanyl-D-alanine ligase/alanine racemase [Ferruginibacter sp.]